MIAWEFWVGLGLGLALSAVAFAILWWRFRRALLQRELTRAVPGPNSAQRGTAYAVPTEVGPDQRVGASLAEAAAGPEDLYRARSRSGAKLSATALPPLPGAVPGEDEPVRLSQQVLLHLVRPGRATPSGTAPESSTQRGMGIELGATQGALSNVLRRLEDGGAIVSEKNHVHGRDRRVKTYVLTLRGRELAAALQRRQNLEEVAPAEPPPNLPPRMR